MLLISLILLLLFCCAKHITMSTLCGGQLCIGPTYWWLLFSHEHFRFWKSIRSTSTCDRNVSACIGFVTGRFLWSVMLFCWAWSGHYDKQRHDSLQDFRLDTFYVVVRFISSSVCCGGVALTQNFMQLTFWYYYLVVSCYNLANLFAW